MKIKRSIMGGYSPLIVVFLLLVLGFGAYFLAKNFQVNLKSGASNVVQSATGKLVKKGTPDFAPCGKNANFTYGLLGSQVLAASTEAGGRIVSTAIPRPTGIRRTPTPVPTPKTPACTPLTVKAGLADKLVGQKVIVTGTYQNGIFYATTIAAIKCTEQCPGKDNVLRNCTPPEKDGTSADSQCNQAGRIEVCGAKNFCCPKAGGVWTTDLTKCPNPKTPTPSPFCVDGVGYTAVSNSCGTGVFRNIYVECHDGTKVTLGGSTSCKTQAAWESEAQSYCKGRFICPTPPPPTPTARPTIYPYTPSPMPTSTPTAAKIFNGKYITLAASCTGTNKAFSITATGTMPTQYGPSGSGFWVIFDKGAQNITYSYQDQSSPQIGVQGSQFYSTRNEGVLNLTGDSSSYLMKICYEPYTTSIPSCSNVLDSINFSMSCQ